MPGKQKLLPFAHFKIVFLIKPQYIVCMLNNKHKANFCN